MTDKQKGLLIGLTKFWLKSTVSYCARHLFANVRSKWPEQLFRTLFWLTAKTTYENDFNNYIEKIEKEKVEAYTYLAKI